MPENTEHIAALVYKLNKGSISQEELEVLMEWYNSHDDENLIIPSQEEAERVKSRILNGVLSRVSAEETQTREGGKYRIGWTTVAAAAAVFIVSLGVWVKFEYNKPTPENKVSAHTIKPGGNKATLTLPDGRTIELSTAQAGIVVGEKMTYTNGMPVENVVGQSSEIQQIMTLHTPRGGTYSIILPDSTQVWLNAESTIKYPNHFDANQRTVELSGEAYFKVKTLYGYQGGKVPFKVRSKQQHIEVLGTQFNISAYAEQNISKTTLVEGKVAITDRDQRFVLLPNQQAVTASGRTHLKKVETGYYTAWKEGKFSFDGKTFEETMSEISRWYDLDIVYENGIPDAELMGDAYRNQNISLVLRLLDVAEIDYKLDVKHRRLIIKSTK